MSRFARKIRGIRDVRRVGVTFLDNACSVFNDALQCVKEIASGVWSDITDNGNDLEFVEANCLKLDGLTHLVLSDQVANITGESTGIIKFGL